jgi:hypothetical protein
MRSYARFVERNSPPLSEFWDQVAAKLDELSGITAHDQYCLDPKCDCQGFLLSLHHFDGSLAGAFHLWFDGRPPTIPDSGPDEIEEVLLRALAASGARFWDEVRRRYREAKEYGRQHPEIYLQVERGQCIPFSDFAPGEPSFVEFTQDRQQFIAVDLYCVAPDCDCHIVTLDIQRLREVEPNRRVGEPFTAVRYNLRQSKALSEENRPLVPRDRKLMAALLATRPDLTAYLRRRYRAGKEFGRKLAQHGGLIDPEPEPTIWRPR